MGFLCGAEGQLHAPDRIVRYHLHYLSNKSRAHNEQHLMENELHESSNHFCFSRDEIGHLTKSCIVDRLAVMSRNDREMYSYDQFLPSRDRQSSLKPNPMLIVDSDWRASIVKWVRLIIIIR